LWEEIQNGLALGAKRFGKAVRSVGVDTWGVDFVLLSKSNELLGLPFHYRDARTRGMLRRAFSLASREEIFVQTGIQFLEINTLYQLLALQQQSPEVLETADCFLTIPDFLNWCLTGQRVCEFTNATTTQCLHPTQREWSFGLLKRLRLPTKIFPEVVQPGTRLGPLRADLAERTGLAPVEIIAPATHDTGSAVAAVPTRNTGRMNWAYISSGTWSLMGIESREAVLSPCALALNVTNEGGIDGTYRVLKNITGLWLLQRCKHSFAGKGKDFDYTTLARLAAEAPAFRSLIDPDDGRFLNPPDMTTALQQFCRDTGQPAPETEGQFVRCVYESLALKYAMVLGSLEELSGARIEVIHVVGGGSQSRLLNQFTASACGRPVIAGPVEATALGNLLVQGRAADEIASLDELRATVRASSELHEFTPADTAAWQAVRERFAKLLAKEQSTQQ
jgi:rhamnulokinase